MSIFRIFGSKVAAHVLKERRLKLNIKSKEGILVGYSEDVKGDKIYFPQSKKVEILKDVIFLSDENTTRKETSTIIHKDEGDEGDEEDEEDEERKDKNDNNDPRRRN